jgi:hypothetical protein
MRSAMSMIRFRSRSKNASMPLYKTARGLSVSSRRGAAARAALKGSVCVEKAVNGAWGVRAVSGKEKISRIGTGVGGTNAGCEIWSAPGKIV